MKLALCVVGCGEFAGIFAKAMAPLRSEVDLYFASREVQKAESYARRFDGLDAFGSYRSAAADPRIGAMYLCNPHHLHMEHSLIAAREGKHILVEKPMARNSSDTGIFRRRSMCTYRISLISRLNSSQGPFVGRIRAEKRRFPFG